MPPDSLHEVEAVLDGDAESLLIYREVFPWITRYIAAHHSTAP